RATYYIPTPVVGRHNDTMNVSFSDGHSKSQRLQLNPNPVIRDQTGFSPDPIDKWVINSGPFRLPANATEATAVGPNFLERGLVQVPDCPSGTTQPCNTAPSCVK